MQYRISTGLAMLTVGFVIGFVGYAGWHDPEGFATANSRLMTEADKETQHAYGRLLAGCVGLGGVSLMIGGVYMIFSPVLS